ncbi:MAG: polar amino acid transport system permease protein [Actinomycetota bacterium]|nr:polar amino acid transport system permease protein [Actinomycetota bacterium]
MPTRASGAGPTSSGDAIRAIPVRHWGRWVSAAAIAAALGWLGWSAVRSGFVDGAQVRHYQFSRLILEGLRATVVLAVAAQTAGIVLGVVFAVLRLSKNVVASWLSGAYIWFFRGTPVLVQLFFWYNGVPSVWKRITIGIPFTHLTLYSARTVDFMTPFMAAFLGLALNEGAYMAEIVRAGILSVDEGQVEAAQALGMTPLLTMRRIVLPQAMRVIVPPTGNEFISMLKTTSLASAITYGELLRRSSDIYSTNLDVVPLLVVASLWYLALTTVASAGQYALERRYGRGLRR